LRKFLKRTFNRKSFALLQKSKQTNENARASSFVCSPAT